jgi:hypothetical protein
MKRPALVIAVMLVLLSTTPMAGSPAPPPGALEVGAAITVKKPVDIEHLAAHPQRYVGRTVRLEGTVKAVCQGKGCWVEVASGKGRSFLAKSLDESVLLPKDCVGRKVVVQGVVTKLPAPGAEAHEHAHEVGDGHVCPAPTYLVATRGAALGPAPR